VGDRKTSFPFAPKKIKNKNGGTKESTAKVLFPLQTNGALRCLRRSTIKKATLESPQSKINTMKLFQTQQRLALSEGFRDSGLQVVHLVVTVAGGALAMGAHWARPSFQV
jgi:hypothetical protein